MLNWIDFCIITYLIFQIFAGSKAGFTNLAIQVFIWFISLYLIFSYAAIVGQKLPINHIIISENLRTVIGALLILILCLIANGFIISICNKILPKIDNQMLAIILGMFAGFVKGCLLLSILMFFINQAVNLKQFDFYNNSMTLKALERFQPNTEQLINVIKDPKLNQQ